MFSLFCRVSTMSSSLRDALSRLSNEKPNEFERQRETALEKTLQDVTVRKALGL